MFKLTLLLSLATLLLLFSLSVQSTTEPLANEQPAASEDARFQFEPHPFRYVFPDFFECNNNVTALRTFMVLLIRKAKTREEKRQVIEQQKPKFLNILSNAIQELREHPEHVSNHREEFDKLVDLMFNVDIETAKVCQYVYDTVYIYDQRKLGKKVITSLEEYQQLLEKDEL